MIMELFVLILFEFVAVVLFSRQFLSNLIFFLLLIIMFDKAKTTVGHFVFVFNFGACGCLHSNFRKYCTVTHCNIKLTCPRAVCTAGLNWADVWRCCLTSGCQLQRLSLERLVFSFSHVFLSRFFVMFFFIFKFFWIPAFNVWGHIPFRHSAVPPNRFAP